MDPKEYYSIHKEEILAKRKKYYTENKIKIREKQKEYKDTHKEQCLESTRQWCILNADRMQVYYDEHRDERQANTRNWEMINKDKNIKMKRTMSCRFSTIKSQAKHRKLPFTLTLEQFIKLINSGCYYCGCSLLESYSGNLDRIDNDKSIGYTINNVLPCCGSCNQTRGDRWTVEETKIMISAILESRKIKEAQLN